MVLEFMLEVPKALQKNPSLNTDESLRVMAHHVLQGLDYLHSKFIFHRVNSLLMQGYQTRKHIHFQKWVCQNCRFWAGEVIWDSWARIYNHGLYSGIQSAGNILPYKLLY